MNYEVINLAEEDLFQIVEYITVNDSYENAEYVYERIKSNLLSLKTFPTRGHLPRECMKENFDLLEIHFSVYRIIYRIIDKKVIVLAIIDGRRNISEQFMRDL